MTTYFDIKYKNIVYSPPTHNMFYARDPSPAGYSVNTARSFFILVTLVIIKVLSSR